ncbi:hypothetical protein [uncultured Roseobacter sp.]|uniref:hypothetical protein n=1 Tax=uncultured Roseobacter sp. TaxID=114847 RepID=UPI0026245AFB|nr:hypothetical protein [uncultured Roseobacter sp.]
MLPPTASIVVDNVPVINGEHWIRGFRVVSGLIADTWQKQFIYWIQRAAISVCFCRGSGAGFPSSKMQKRTKAKILT